MLGVLLLALIPLAKNPKTWKFFAPQEEKPKTLARDLDQPAADKKSPSPATPAEKKADSGATSAEPSQQAAEENVPGPTDLDQEQREAAIEEFQAVSDRTTELQPEEMPIYWRMFEWSKNQSFAEMNRRAKGRVVLNDFMQSPEVWRGELVSLDLNVRQVLAYDAPENPAGVKKVYEIRGWTTESKAWLYFVVTAWIPPEMPVGADVYENVRVTGYFLKLQGYHAAGAGPEDKPLVAPLLVGRIDWRPSPLATKQEFDYSWLWWVGGLGILYIGVRLLLPRLFGRSSAKAEKRFAAGWPEDDLDRGKLTDWLSSAEAGKLAEDSTAPDASPRAPPGESANGRHSRQQPPVKGNGKQHPPAG